MSLMWICQVCLHDGSQAALTTTSSSHVVGCGCIFNQFDEPARAVQDCVVIDLDKKQLKKLCMLLRWKFFGVGAANCSSSAGIRCSGHLFQTDRFPRLCRTAGVCE